MTKVLVTFKTVMEVDLTEAYGWEQVGEFLGHGREFLECEITDVKLVDKNPYCQGEDAPRSTISRSDAISFAQNLATIEPRGGD